MDPENHDQITVVAERTVDGFYQFSIPAGHMNEDMNVLLPDGRMMTATVRAVSEKRKTISIVLVNHPPE